MKSFLIVCMILFPVLALAQVQPALNPSTNYLATTTRGSGGQTYTQWVGSDGSTAQVIQSPGGTVTVTQQPSFAESDAHYRALEQETHSILKHFTDGDQD